MADITSKMLDVRIGTSNDWAQENLSLVAGNLYYVDLMKNDGNPSGAMALFLAMGTTKADARYLTTLMPSALDASVTGDVAVGDTLVTALSKLNNKITSVAEDAAKMFTIRGTIGTEEDGGDRQGIPPTAEKGDAWRIVTEGSYTFNGKEEKLEVGDWIICSFVSSDNTPTWVVLQANLDLSSVTFEGSDIKDNGFEIKLSGAGINASTTVPFATASKGGLLTAEDYGKLNTGQDIIYKNNTATATDAGIVTLSDSIESESDTENSVAATPKAVKAVNDALNEATQILSDKQKEIVKGIEVNNAKHSTDSQKILVLDEAGQTFHADVHVLAQDEGDNAGIRLHTNDTSDKVIVNEADHSAKSDVLVVEGKDYSVKAVEIDKNDTKEIRLQSTDENVTVLSVDRADLADDLGGRQETTPEEFIYQPTAGEFTSIKDGMASIKSLQGNSVVWNQYARKLDSSFASYYNNTHLSNITVSANNTLQCDINELGQLEHYFDYMFQYMPNHKYLALLDVKSYTTSSGLHVYYNSNLTQAIARVSAINQWETLHLMFTPMESPVSTRFRLYGALGASITEVGTIYFRNPQIIDLTQMFGEGNEPTTIEEFNARKPRIADEYAYNEGEIISFNGDAIKSVGFNQFDKDSVEKGYYYSYGLQKTQNSSMSTTRIRVLPNQAYCSNIYTNVNVYGVLWLDNNGNVISGGFGGYTTSEFRIITSPSNAVYAILNVNNAGLDSFVFNLVHSEYRNGEYEPYTEHTLYLPSAAQDMKSAGTAYDEIYVDDAKNKKFHARRMGEVDLGDLTWNIASDGPKPFFKGRVTGGLTTLGAGVMPNMIVSKKYNVVVSGYDATQRADKSITWQRDVSAIMLYDYDYTDVESLKASLQGVNLIYELAKPIITEITDYEGYMDYPVSDFGTEEVLSLGNTAPLKAEIQYGFNAVDTIRNNRLAISDIKTDLAKNYYDKEDVDSKIEPINNTIDGILSSPMDLWGMNQGNGYMFAYKEDENGNDISPEGVVAKVGEIFIVDKEGQYFSGTTDDNGDDLFFSCTIGNVLVCTKAGGQDAQFAMYDNYKDALYAIATKRIDGNAASIAGLSDEIDQANATADEAKSLAENAEQDASEARESTQVLGDHLNNVTFSGNSVDNGYNIELSDGESTNNPTMPNGDSVNLGSSITIPKATASLNGVMSKEDKSWLDGVKDGISSVAKADAVVSVYLGEIAGKTITELKAAIDDIQSRYNNKDAFIRIRFGAQSPFITAWNDNDANYVIEAGQQWILQPIGYVGSPNYASWILSSYSANEHYIVAKNGTWGSIRRIAFIDSKVSEAFNADKANRADNATNANNALNADKINVDMDDDNTAAFPTDDAYHEKITAVSVHGEDTPMGERTVVLNIGDTSDYGAQIVVVTDSIDGVGGIGYREKGSQSWKTIAFLDSKVASADKADKDGNGNNIAETYAKATDLDAIKSALTWKPFTISSN